ncbi:hypothetical protein H4219_004123 [Mycoemilia scoparia]|uniref:Uncharacterized protein n=1 Tax=Mycoemilia scoparia TaxID=417184 RepID=A0A9W7ZYG6_9FUNG|nr:hypothetical protein H4219_004123 [Mycoemilia scoparia]
MDDLPLSTKRLICKYLFELDNFTGNTDLYKDVVGAPGAPSLLSPSAASAAPTAPDQGSANSQPQHIRLNEGKKALWALASTSQSWREVALKQLWGTLPLHTYARTTTHSDRYQLVRRDFDEFVHKLLFNCFEYHRLNQGVNQGKGAQCIPPCIALDWSNLTHVVLALNLIKSWEALCRTFRKHIPNLLHLEFLRMDAPYNEVLQYVIRYLPSVKRFRLVQLDQSYEYQLGKCRERERGAANLLPTVPKRFEKLGIGGQETTHEWIHNVCRTQPNLSQLYLGVVWMNVLDAFDGIENIPDAVMFRIRLHHFTIEKIYSCFDSDVERVSRNPCGIQAPMVPSQASGDTAAAGGGLLHREEHQNDFDIPIPIDSNLFPCLVTLSIRDIQWVPATESLTTGSAGIGISGSKHFTQEPSRSPIARQRNWNVNPDRPLRSPQITIDTPTPSPIRWTHQPPANSRPSSTVSAAAHSIPIPPTVTHVPQNLDQVVFRNLLSRLFSRKWEYLRKLTLPSITDMDSSLIAESCPVLFSLHSMGSDQYRPPLTNRGFLTLSQGIPTLRQMTIKVYFYGSEYCNALDDGIIISEMSQTQVVNHGMYVNPLTLTRHSWSCTTLSELDISYSSISVIGLQALLMECPRLISLSVRVDTAIHGVPLSVITTSVRRVPQQYKFSKAGWVIHTLLRYLKIQLSGPFIEQTMSSLISHTTRLNTCELDAGEKSAWILDIVTRTARQVHFSLIKNVDNAWATIPEW